MKGSKAQDSFMETGALPPWCRVMQPVRAKTTTKSATNRFISSPYDDIQFSRHGGQYNLIAVFIAFAVNRIMKGNNVKHMLSPEIIAITKIHAGVQVAVAKGAALLGDRPLHLVQSQYRSRQSQLIAESGAADAVPDNIQGTEGIPLAAVNG